MSSRKVSMVEIDEQIKRALRKMEGADSDREYYYAKGVFNALMWARYGDMEGRPFGEMPLETVKEPSQ